MPNPDQLRVIQDSIARLAGNSFLLKGWTVTLVAGLTAFAKADAQRSFAWIACFVVVALGLLDAYYLAMERKFRDLYNEEAALAGNASWQIHPPKLRSADVLSALSSPPVYLLHGTAIAVAVVVALSE